MISHLMGYEGHLKTLQISHAIAETQKKRYISEDPGAVMLRRLLGLQEN